MRVLTVSHFYESHGGGIERVAGQLCRQFAALGAQPVWAASSGDGLAASADGVALTPLACVDPAEALTGLPMPLPRWRALRLLAREVARADTVVVHDALYATSIAAMLLARRQGKRVVLIQHIAAIPFASAWLRAAMRLANSTVTRAMLRAADEVLFISDTVRADLLGTPARRSYALVFNGVDGALFHPAAAAARATGSGKHVLFAGRYVAKKGLAVLRAVAAARPGWRFTLVGGGPIRPADWGLANVRDVGPQSPSALADLYRAADLLLLPSVGEGYPLVIQEAMACGLPVVCGAPANRADPAAARWLTGVAIDLADPAASATRCIAAIETLAMADSARAAMAAYAAEHYRWEAMARAVLDACAAPPNATR